MDTAKNIVFIYIVCMQPTQSENVLKTQHTYLLLYISRVIQNQVIIILHLLKCVVAVLLHCFGHEFDRSIFKGSLLT